MSWPFEMVNIRGSSSGLCMNIWIGPRGKARYGPRIKVQMDHRSRFNIDNLAVVSLTGKVLEGELDAIDLDMLRRYIVLNRQAILDHWSERTDGVGLVQSLKPLGD